MIKSKLFRKRLNSKASNMEPDGIHDNILRKLLQILLICTDYLQWGMQSKALERPKAAPIILFWSRLALHSSNKRLR